MRSPFSPHPHQHMLSLVFLVIVILTGVRGYLLVVSDLHFPNDERYGASLHMLVDNLFLFWKKNVCSVSLPQKETLKRTHRLWLRLKIAVSDYH